MNSPKNGHDPLLEAQIVEEMERLGKPEQRMDFLQANGIRHHFLVSGPELAAIQQGTSQLNGEIRNWRVLAQALFGVSSAEEALAIAQTQKKHRQGIFDDRQRYRNALLEVMKRTKADNPEAWQIAFNAINPPKS